MTRVCLVNPLYSSINYSPPLGLAYIASLLEKHKHEVMIIDRTPMLYRDCSGVHDIDRDLVTRIQDFSPQIVGIGSMTIQIQDACKVARIARVAVKDAFIILGGFHVTAEPEMTLRDCSDVDAVCLGEGENTILDLANGKQASGVYTRQLPCTIPQPTQDLDDIPFPARHLLDMDFYTRRNDMVIPNIPAKVATVMTSRGCPFSCKFCANRLIYKKVRFHSVAYTVEEILSILKNYRVDAISFLDTEFLARRDRVEELCLELVRKGINRRVRWSCSARVSSVDPDILKLMRVAGCFYINYGLESGSQRMLDSMNKRATVADNYKAVRMANDAGILVNSAFITNLPKETADDLRQTEAFLRGSDIYCASLNNLLPLPGSPYYYEMVSSGVLSRSGKLWGEIGELKGSSSIRIFSDIPRDSFIDISSRVSRLIATENTIRSIRANWFRHPAYAAKKLWQLALLHASGVPVLSKTAHILKGRDNAAAATS